ncbi:uncharacterized protein PIERCE2 [Dasypus novemcinctus]|uniref:uncharacterized protein PIERCE2 n=1 Tax=Dasypus novemcinctus TaxID=9361 RepID=UPI0039C96824
MPGLVVQPAPHAGRGRSEELRLPSRSAARQGKVARTPAWQPRSSQHPGPGVGRRRGRLLWRQSRQRIRGFTRRTAPWIRRIVLHLRTEPKVHLLFDALIGSSKKSRVSWVVAGLLAFRCRKTLRSPEN